MHPPFSFPSCGKENGPCTVQKKRPFRRAPVQWPSARNGGRRIGACADFASPSGTLFSSTRSILPSRGGWCGGRRGGRRIASAPIFAGAGAAGGCGHPPESTSPHARPGQRVAKRNARKGERVKCVLAPRPKTHRAAGTDCQICTAPRRARRPSIANTQALSHADSRTATLHGCAKLRPKAFFSFGPCTARFLFGKTEKKMGGVHCLAIIMADSHHPNGWFFVLDSDSSIKKDK